MQAGHVHEFVLHACVSHASGYRPQTASQSQKQFQLQTALTWVHYTLVIFCRRLVAKRVMGFFVRSSELVSIRELVWWHKIRIWPECECDQFFMSSEKSFEKARPMSFVFKMILGPFKHLMSSEPTIQSFYAFDPYLYKNQIQYEKAGLNTLFFHCEMPLDGFDFSLCAHAPIWSNLPHWPCLCSFNIRSPGPVAVRLSALDFHLDSSWRWAMGFPAPSSMCNFLSSRLTQVLSPTPSTLKKFHYTSSPSQVQPGRWKHDGPVGTLHCRSQAGLESPIWGVLHGGNKTDGTHQFVRSWYFMIKQNGDENLSCLNPGNSRGKYRQLLWFCLA